MAISTTYWTRSCTFVSVVRLRSASLVGVDRRADPRSASPTNVSRALPHALRGHPDKVASALLTTGNSVGNLWHILNSYHYLEGETHESSKDRIEWSQPQNFGFCRHCSSHSYGRRRSHMLKNILSLEIHSCDIIRSRTYWNTSRQRYRVANIL